MKITADSVKKARPSEREFTLWDDELRGFGLRVRPVSDLHPNGRKIFVVKYRIGRGRDAAQRKTSLGEPGSPYTAAEARGMARNMIAKARLGEDPTEALKTRPDRNPTLNEFIDMWIRDASSINRRTGRKRKASSVAADIRRLDIHVRPLLGEKLIKDITPDMLRRFRSDVAAGKTARTVKTRSRGLSRATGGDGTAVQTLRILSGVLAHGVDSELLEQNPVKPIKLPAANEKERFLSGEELTRLGRSLEKMEAVGLHPLGINIIRLLALTGARRSEIEGLRWQSVDFDRGALILQDTKSGRAAFPLSGPALALLSSLPREQGSPWVFPATRGKGHYRGVNKVWERVRTDAELEGVRLHDLRHSFASLGAASGIGLQTVGKLLGHKQAATTARYSHLSDNPLRAAADQIGGVVAARMGLVKPKLVGDD